MRLLIQSTMSNFQKRESMNFGFEQMQDSQQDRHSKIVALVASKVQNSSFCFQISSLIVVFITTTIQNTHLKIKFNYIS